MRLPSKDFHWRPQQAVNTPYFSLKMRKNGADTNRIGIVVGIAVHKSAVKRNFWRRQAKGLLRESEKHYGDLLLILFPKVNTLTRAQFRKKIQAAIRELPSS